MPHVHNQTFYRVVTPDSVTVAVPGSFADLAAVRSYLASILT